MWIRWKNVRVFQQIEKELLKDKITRLMPNY